ncbi:hypothetical protein [Arthrobacter sp. SDTb3-6]|uniref:hypothetical protein n=1 Tax=Arthrobacter sp. SDTb3-6 TaxID=2713571 RepID=UPI00159E809C|nr:hypothetical protein [Arthrobacter sp. SDTb3-6]NVM98159.1 hypothetical protein [Arthrobacter sp. SDTb3-6]
MTALAHPTILIGGALGPEPSLGAGGDPDLLVFSARGDGTPAFATAPEMEQLHPQHTSAPGRLLVSGGTPVPTPDGRVRPHVLADQSAVEIFANGKPPAARVCPALGRECVSLAAAAGTARLPAFDPWTTGGIFEGESRLFP